MASSKKTSNGRSPLVNPQRQITAFFSKKPESASSASPSPSPVLSKKNPNPNPDGMTSPITPSPLQSKSKPVLLISPKLASASASTSPGSLISGKKQYGAEVVDRRIRVYWPLDKTWYEGCVKSFHKTSGKHTVQYDDAEEETINLLEEKIEWIEEPAKKKLRRLRKISVVEDEEDEEEDHKELEDDSDDEDWGSKVEKEMVEDEDGLEDSDLELEEETERTGARKHVISRKRKVGKGEQIGSSCTKKHKKSGELKYKSDTSTDSIPSKEKQVEPSKRINPESGKVSALDSNISVDAAERFVTRDAQKLRFVEIDRMDARRRRPGDADYDPRTLFLPPNFVKGLTGGQKQWWEFKSQHMDKVLFFKMGKFYELFEMDAHVGAKELGLQYMKGEQPHCGFPEKNFSINVEKLAIKGYRVLVVEQTETPEQLELRRKEEGSKDKVVKREICAVITKGTLTEGEILSTNPDASYLMALAESCENLTNQPESHIFGICLVDVATSKIVLAQFRDDADCSSLCCLLSELRPVEIVKPAKLLSPEAEKALFRHTRNPLINELIPFSEFWNAEKTVQEVKNIYQRIGDHSCYSTINETTLHPSGSSSENGNRNCLPDVLSNLASDGENGSQALSALGGALFYLRQSFLDETLLRFAKFELLPCCDLRKLTHKPYMVLDAAALENLEIFENSRNGDSTGTLYDQLNHCITAFGRRLLRTWLARPLYHFKSIKERQDAVAELKGVNQPYVLGFRKEISKIPDMERLLARIFTSSEASGRNASKVVLYEDAAKKQLLEFISALRGCETLANASSSFCSALGNVESSLLHHLLTPGIPNISSTLRYFKDAFDWEEAYESGRVIPREGADVEYDAACQRVKDIESNLQKHLKEQRKLLGNASIRYVTIGKDAYLLEVPESLSHSIPKEYELKSSKKGFFRYWTPVIKKLMGELSLAESEKEQKLKSILQRLIGRFCENHCEWRQMVSTIAELDVLISLSIASDYYEGKTCRPIISPPHSDNLPCLSAKGLGHPMLRSDTLGKGSFVTNDVTLGGSGNASFILLTGPNMGGKSTLLRQICLATILAQIGADVPAESFELVPVDRIFVRMGAKDQIMSGHSTFLTELLETASMMNSATPNSLVALDELGRGTSTSDGQAIAASVLEHFICTVQCRGMFSTHYHRLAVDYENNTKVSLCHMACHVAKGVRGLEEVIFLYKLTPGACPKSYGVNVARLAGLPDTVLQRAVAKSQEFEGSHCKRLNLSSNELEDEASLIIKNAIKIVAAAEPSNEHSVTCLANLQSNARLLLQPQQN
ncbi:DNA mismatch repair protein MSH6 isoform X2 [Andrographis paniculata]|uniref:DNA mismatch repair protein MSH6 isoform X2 n=1 Tax=Andrographis paniculata TaxID=175694 RepID=UPI0021E8053D|nr:DNA mismatch repair protein MSH6 isoform X2 [Andrographis paniculata]